MRSRYFALLLLFITVLNGDETLYRTLNTFPETEPAAYSESKQPPYLPMNITHLQKDYEAVSVTLNDSMPRRYLSLIDDTVYLQGVMLTSIGILALLPENITNWSEAKLKDKSLWMRWKENVSSGPVWDKDDWMVNYIGHPVSGAWYYTMARNDGMTKTESAVYSFLLSTFFWEYGYEAFAEVPSTQDLIFTPLLGSVLGEGFMILQKKLDAREGVLLGSKTAGNVAYFLIDPLGHIAHGLEWVLINAGFDAHVTVKVHTYPNALNMPPVPFATTPEYAMRYGQKEYALIITIQ